MGGIGILREGGEFECLLRLGRVFVKVDLEARLALALKIRERLDGAAVAGATCFAAASLCAGLIDAASFLPA